MPAAGALDILVQQEAAEEASNVRRRLTGKALRTQLLKTNAELKADQAAYKVKAAKDVGASRVTINTLCSIATNTNHFASLCYEWNIGQTGVRKTKLNFEMLQKHERQDVIKLSHSTTFDFCWRNRPYGFDGDLKAACVYQQRLLLDGQDSHVVSLEHLSKSINSLEQNDADSMMQRMFPGSGGFRQIQMASEKVRAIERRLGGPMDISEKYRRWPCLQPGWPDEIAHKKLPFELQLEAQERRQEKYDECASSPSLRKILSKPEETSDGGGYKGKTAAVFASVFGDDAYVPSDDEDVSSPSLVPHLGPREEGIEVKATSPVKRERETVSIWEDGNAAGGFDQWDDEDVAHMDKKRRKEVDGLSDDEPIDEDDEDETHGYY